MAAQFDFDSLAATETTMTPRRSGRTAAANPFLDKGWVKDSYEYDRAMQVDVPGKFVEYERTGKQAGPAMKLDGEAVSAVTMIRRAADALGIGVRIETSEGKRKGMITIKFMGVDRKKTKKNGGIADADADAGAEGAEE